MKQGSTPHVQQKKITASSSISSSSFVPGNSTTRNKSYRPSSPLIETARSNSEQSGQQMIDHIFRQLKQSIEGDVLQQELNYQEARQKTLDDTHAQLNQYKDYLTQYSTHQIPYLQKYKDRHHYLSDNIMKLTEEVNQETIKVSNTKNDLNELVQFCQKQSDILKEKVILLSLNQSFLTI